MRQSYETLSMAMSDLKEKGYTEELNLKRDHIECINRKFNIGPNEFDVDEMHRFEGMTNPDDSSILYAITSPEHDVKGLLVDAYGVYSDPLSQEMIDKLKYDPSQS